MANITDYILSKTNKIKPKAEITPGFPDWQMYNSGGVEIEIAELLYSLVRVWKPEHILETGTHLGISSLYMALALEENKNNGMVDTYEIIKPLQKQAQALWVDLEMTGRIRSHLKPSLKVDRTEPIDFLFLDSEPQLRFDEFNKFWDLVVPGGLILIHDLHASLGHHGQTHHGVYDWPYGNWRPELGHYVSNYDVQILHCPNPRGMTIFQKTKPTDENIDFLRT